MCAALLPDAAEIERVPCSSPDHAPDLLARAPRAPARAGSCCSATSTRSSRHDDHQPLDARRRQAGRLGRRRHEGRRRARRSASCARSPSARTPTPRSRCCSSATRSGARRRSPTSSASPAGTPACASRPASTTPTARRAWSCGARRPGRSACAPTGRAAHSGSAPDRGRNALLALAAAAQAVAACHDPHGPAPPDRGPDRDARRRRVQRRARPRRAVLRPARRRRSAAFDARARRDPRRGRRRDPRRRAGPPVARAWTRARRSRRCSSARAPRSGGRCAGVARGGASDASHFAAAIPVTIDGLGPRGGSAHNPGEYVLAAVAAHRAQRSRSPCATRARSARLTASDSSSRGRSSASSSPPPPLDAHRRRRRPS